MKINRRDYLLQMGAGAAGFMAAAESPLFGQTKKKPNPRQKQASAERATARGLRWPVTNTAPSHDAFVTAIYSGLSQFAYDDGRFVDVAFHRGSGGHKLEIQIYKNPHASCTIDKMITPGVNDRLKLVVSGQAGGNPDVFHVDCNPFDRNNAADRYADDFRWLPDLHSFDFYPEGYELNRVTGPRLAVHAGTFYTRTRSKSTFKLVNAGLIGCDDELYDFGHIALNLATAITAPSNVLLLDTNDDPLYTFETGNKYQIVFKNECESCPHSPSADCNERNWNDFHFSRDLVKRPLGRRKYGLKVKRRCGADCARPDFCILTKRHPDVNDESPCSGSAFGQAPGLP